MTEQMERAYFTQIRTDGGPEGVTVPQELLDIQAEWKALADSYGDVGTCVLGAGFEFDYNGRPYKMPPVSKWQGSCSWEAFRAEIHARLEEAGATNIRYECGIMD